METSAEPDCVVENLRRYWSVLEATSESHIGGEEVDETFKFASTSLQGGPGWVLLGRSWGSWGTQRGAKVARKGSQEALRSDLRAEGADIEYTSCFARSNEGPEFGEEAHTQPRTNENRSKRPLRGVPGSRRGFLTESLRRRRLFRGKPAPVLVCAGSHVVVYKPPGWSPGSQIY